VNGKASSPGSLWGSPRDVDELVAEIEPRNGKLGGVLGSRDEADGQLEATLFRSRRAGEACDQSYLQARRMKLPSTPESLTGKADEAVNDKESLTGTAEEAVNDARVVDRQGGGSRQRQKVVDRYGG